jgi:putative acetyltransferase
MALLDIRLDDLSGAAIAQFLLAHVNDMRATSPPESTHVLDLDGLKNPAISFWSGWLEGTLVASAALKNLGNGSGEVKSMRTDSGYRGQGLASLMLQHLIDQAQHQGLHTLYLETGSMAFFEPARKLYEKHGFAYCEPFGSYKLDPNSVFMQRAI